jgi:hypothetical protein
MDSLADPRVLAATYLLHTHPPNRCLLLRFEDQLKTTSEKENAASVKNTVGQTYAESEGPDEKTRASSDEESTSALQLSNSDG